MFNRLLAVLVLGFSIISFGGKADWSEAIQAYNQQNYLLAEQEFKQLLPLGNANAAYNLAVMALRGEGQQVDYVKGAAYLQFAAELARPDAAELFDTVMAALSSEQKQYVQLAYEELNTALLITHRFIYSRDLPERTASVLKVTHREKPRYPKEAAEQGYFGYVTLWALVDGNGVVQIVDIVESYPENVFDRSATTALKKWRYEKTGQQHIIKVQLDYMLSTVVNTKDTERNLQQGNVWKFAVANSAPYQEMLGTTLHLLDIQSRKYFVTEKASQADNNVPDLSLFRTLDSELSFDTPSFDGKVTVEVDTKGKIIAIPDSSQLISPEESQLIGQSLHGKMNSGMYRLSNTVGNQIIVRPVTSLPNYLDAGFWWEKAAKNGHKRAQKILAARDEQWQQYLLSQEDPAVLAWSGAQQILAGQSEQGKQMLERAIALDYSLATALKKQLM